MARRIGGSKKNTTPRKNTKGPTEAPQAPAGKEKFLDRMGRYSLYGQMFGNDSANMSMGQRIGGAAYSAFEQATLGQMGTLGKAMSAGISARGKKDQAGGSGPHDTQDIQFQQIKGDDVVAAINQSTGQMVAGLNTVNHTLGRGFNRLGDDIQAQGQALNSIVGANEDVALQMRELYEQLNKMAYDRGGGGGANASTLAGRGGGPDGGPAAGGGGSILGNLFNTLLTGAGLAAGAAALKKLFGIGDDPDGKTPKVEDPDGKKTKGKEPPAKTEKPREPKGATDPEGKKIGGQYKAAPATPGSSGSWYDDAMKAFKGAGKTVLNLGAKVASPVLAAIAIWDAWQEISALDPKMPLDKYRAEVAKIIGKAVGDFGLALVGGVIGGIIVGAVTGPGAIVGMIGGALFAEYALGDNVDAIVDSVVNYLYKGTDEPVKKPANVDTKTGAKPVDTQNASDASNLAGPSPTSNYTDDAAKLLTKQRMKEEGEDLVNQGNMVKDFALKMGLSPDNAVAKSVGGVPVEINGVPVPDELYTDEQRKKIQTARDAKKMMQGGVKVASTPAATMTDVPVDAAPAGAEPPVGGATKNWDEDFYKQFPDWMNVKDLDYPPSRLMGPPDTSEEKLKEQERVSEQAQKETIAEDITINAKELLYKADKIVFDTEKLEFKYSKLKETQEQPPGEEPAPDGASPAAPPSPTTAAGAPPSTRLFGGAIPGSAAEAAGPAPSVAPPSGVTPPAPPAGATPAAPPSGATPGPSASIPPGGFGPAVKDGSNGRLPDSQLAPIGIGSLKAQPSAAAAFKAMREAAGAAGVKLGATDAYRTYEAQVDVKRRKPNLAATPGRSNHGWGLAFDMDFGGNVNSPGYKWMVENAAKFGFKGPLKKPNEPWHWEYVGGGGGAQPDATQVTQQPGGAGEGAPVSAGSGGGGASPSPVTSSGGGAATPMPTSGGGGGENPLASMLGGGGSPFGMASNMLGPVIGSMSKNTALNAAAPPANPSTTNINVGSNRSSTGGSGGAIDPSSPQPAISSMFAKLFEGSALFG